MKRLLWILLLGLLSMQGRSQTSFTSLQQVLDYADKNSKVLQQSKQSTKQWLKSSEVRKMLGISHGTLQNLRITRSLPYTKLGGIMFYKSEDIEKILEAGLVSKKY